MRCNPWVGFWSKWATEKETEQLYFIDGVADDQYNVFCKLPTAKWLLPIISLVLAFIVEDVGIWLAMVSVLVYLLETSLMHSLSTCMPSKRVSDWDIHSKPAIHWCQASSVLPFASELCFAVGATSSLPFLPSPRYTWGAVGTGAHPTSRMMKSLGVVLILPTISHVVILLRLWSKREFKASNCTFFAPLWWILVNGLP